VINLDATFGEQLFDIAVGQAIAEIPAHRQQDHVWREPETNERRGSRTATNHPSTLRPAPDPSTQQCQWKVPSCSHNDALQSETYPPQGSSLFRWCLWRSARCVWPNIPRQATTRLERSAAAQLVLGSPHIDGARSARSETARDRGGRRFQQHRLGPRRSLVLTLDSIPVAYVCGHG
jgi:hypothetical protein